MLARALLAAAGLGLAAASSAPAEGVAPSVIAMSFGIYDSEGDLAKLMSEGWTLASAAELNEWKGKFVQYYNERHGLPIVHPFVSKECCFTVRGGKKLTISPSKYETQFPASTEHGTVRCNPEGGYSEYLYQFYKIPTLTLDESFGESDEGCGSDHNPGIFYHLHMSDDPAFVNFIKLGTEHNKFHLDVALALEHERKVLKHLRRGTSL